MNSVSQNRLPTQKIDIEAAFAKISASFHTPQTTISHLLISSNCHAHLEFVDLPPKFADFFVPGFEQLPQVVDFVFEGPRQMAASATAAAVERRGAPVRLEAITVGVRRNGFAAGVTAAAG